MQCSLPLVPPHLNFHGLAIKSTPEKGRGVFGKIYCDVKGMVELKQPLGCPLPDPSSATRRIGAGTVMEINPVHLFGKREYEGHARFTLLGHYTFTWGDGCMALPLGLGKLTSEAIICCIMCHRHSNTPLRDPLLKCTNEIRGVRSSSHISRGRP